MISHRKFFLNGGMVLMYALSVLVILSVIGLSLQTTGSSMMALSKESQYRRLAQHAADSGIRYGTAYVRGVLDPLDQWTNPAAPAAPVLRTDYGVVDSRQGHPFTFGGVGPVHPCNIYWRLLPTHANPVQAWIRGNNASYTTTLALIPLDPAAPPSASNPLMYMTSFALSIKAVAIRTMADLPTGVTQPTYGSLVNVGVRWRDLVDQSGARHCKECAQSLGATTPPTWLSPAPGTKDEAHPPWAKCFDYPTDNVAVNEPSTLTCTMNYTQPYVLTATGTCFINDPANPGQIKTPAVATVVTTQMITVTTRLKKTATAPDPLQSQHSSYVVTQVSQER